ncbi:MAG: DUF4956 domain-containing protein [Bacteroidota bacterium]|jgi:hypothetical protein|nr:DUF4956 domain-containing protein [Bacteroidota bacterium]
MLLDIDFLLKDYKIFDSADFFDLVLRFSVNFLVTFIIVRLIYYPLHKNKDYLFTYFIFNSIIFLILYVMNNVKMEFGVSFGLFAVFSILRYRTEDIPIKEMVYLFIIIAVALVNAMSTKKVSVAEIAFANIMILVMIYTLENIWLMRHESTRTIVYEKIDLIKPENYSLLLQDLRERTGLNVHRAEIKNTDFQTDTARITIFYYLEKVNEN